MSLGTKETTGAPLLTLRGTEDASNEAIACLRRENEIRSLGSVVEAHLYKGAGHSWDAWSPRQMRADAPYTAGCEIVYDAQGRGFVDGETIVDFSQGTPRSERFMARLSTLEPLKDCIYWGYVMGRDDETKSQSDAHLLGFLYREFELD